MSEGDGVKGAPLIKPQTRCQTERAEDLPSGTLPREKQRHWCRRGMKITSWPRRRTKTETICDGDACTRSTGATCRGGTTNHENDGHAPTTLRVAGASAVCAVPCFFFCAHLNTLETQTMQDVNETLNAIQKLIQLTPELTPQRRRRSCSPQSRRQLQGPSRRHPDHLSSPTATQPPPELPRMRGSMPAAIAMLVQPSCSQLTQKTSCFSRPPTSPPSTTKRHLLRGPTSSG